MKLTIFWDGGGNRDCGKAAGAAVAYDDTGTEIARHAVYIPGKTNNEAEYAALQTALGLAIELGGTDVTCLGDSELVVRQVNHRYLCRKPHLQPLLRGVWAMMAVLPKVEVREIPKTGTKKKRRTANAVADALATECMDLEREIDWRAAA